MMRFKNRREAGRQLAAKLVVYAARPDVVVLALPRGGVPVACEVAWRLAAPLDVFPVRKPGVPQQPKLAFGAIASGNIRVLNPSIVASYHLSAQTIETVTRQEQQELERREKTYRAACPSLEPAGKISILLTMAWPPGSLCGRRRRRSGNVFPPG